MNEKNLLSSSEIMALSNNYYDNLAIVIELCSASDLETRIAAIEKLADDFSPSKFVSKYYPQEEVFDLYRNATKSEITEEVIGAISSVTEIENLFAREICLENLYHQNVEVREEAICCLGYVGSGSDSIVLNDIMDKEQNDLLKVAAFNSLLRLGHVELFNMDRINLSQLSMEAYVSVLENLCTLTGRFDLAQIYKSIASYVEGLGSEEINDELFDLKYRIEKEATFKSIENIFSCEKIDWRKVLELMGNSDEDIRFRALTNIGSGSKPNKKTMPNKPPQQVFDKVVALIDDGDDEVRAEAISVLGDWEYANSIDLISKHLHDNSELVRLDAIYALGEIGGEKAVEQLNLLVHEDCSEIEKTRLYQALIRCGYDEFFDLWLKGLESSDALVRANVAGGVWSIWSNELNTTLESKLKNARNNETHISVLNEIDDALDWLKSNGSSNK